jgi:Vps54-like protein
MQVAGLKSITAKHLALASQCLGALINLHPMLRAIHTAPLPHSRKALLVPEFDRVLQVCHDGAPSNGLWSYKACLGVPWPQEVSRALWN